MNSLGWAILFKMGCLCSKETVTIAGVKYTVRERIAQGFVNLKKLQLKSNLNKKKSFLQWLQFNRFG